MPMVLNHQMTIRDDRCLPASKILPPVPPHRQVVSKGEPPIRSSEFPDRDRLSEA